MGYAVVIAMLVCALAAVLAAFASERDGESGATPIDGSRSSREG